MDTTDIKTEKTEEGLKPKKKRVGFINSSRKGSNSTSDGGDCSAGGVPLGRCQAQGCEMDLTDVKKYYWRHKVCEVHAKAAAVIVSGIRKRFCQQCSRFHELTEFDGTKRSCRSRLAGHNERRRKSSTESQGKASYQKAGVVSYNKNY